MSVEHCHDRRGTETKNRIIPHIEKVFELQKQIHMFIRTRQRQIKRGFYWLSRWTKLAVKQAATCALPNGGRLIYVHL